MEHEWDLALEKIWQLVSEPMHQIMNETCG